MTHTFTIGRTTFDCRVEANGWPPFPGRTGPSTWVINIAGYGDTQGQASTGTELESAESIADFEAEVRNQIWHRIGKVWMRK